MSRPIPRRIVLTAAVGVAAAGAGIRSARALPPTNPPEPDSDPTTVSPPPATRSPSGSRRLRAVLWNINEGHGAYTPSSPLPQPPMHYKLPGVARYLKALDADVVMLNDMLIRNFWGGGINQAEYLAQAARYPYWQAIKTNATGGTAMSLL